MRIASELIPSATAFTINCRANLLRDSIAATYSNSDPTSRSGVRRRFCRQDSANELLQSKSFLLHSRRRQIQTSRIGAVAQLGERCVRNAEVGGSTPLRSTSCSFDSIVVLNGPSPTSVTGRRFFESMLSRKVGVPVFHEELRDWHFFQDWGRELGSSVYRHATFPLEGDYPHEVVKLFQARSRFEKRGL